MPTLTFRLKLPNTKQASVIQGCLKFDTADREYSATAGLAGSQYLGSWKAFSQGPLPPSDKIAEQYEVATQGILLTTCRCSEGFIYQILPKAVTADGVTRGNFSIHLGSDGVPGSTGCIVVKKEDEWNDFQYELKKLKIEGIKSLPLYVIYN